MEEKFDILIIGAGPTGLIAAIMLVQAGLSVRIIDKKEGPTQQSKSLAIQARTLEILSTLRLADRFIERGHQISRINLYDERGIFGSLNLEGLDTPFPFVLFLSQSQTERLLLEHLSELGCDVEWGRELIDIRSGRAKLWGGEEIFAEYILGCDGYRSVVAEKLQIDFKGTDCFDRFFLADLVLQDQDNQESCDNFFSDEGHLACFPFGDSHMRVALGNVGSDKLSLPELKTLLERRSGREWSISKMIWSSTFITHTKRAKQFRKGHVFLLGDAAHIHSPLGGQGMNSGIQDAHNLAWKLTYVLQKKADPELLDSYEKERMPIADELLHWSQQTMNMVELCGNAGRVRNRTLAYLFSRPWSCRKIKKKISQLSLSYRKSPLSDDHLPNPLHSAFSRDQREFKLALQTGDRAPDAAIDIVEDIQTKTLFDLLSQRHFILLIFCPQESLDSELMHLYNALPDCVVPYLVTHCDIERCLGRGGIIVDRSGELHRKYGGTVPSLYLIRPDGMIAHRCVGHELKSVASLSLLRG